MRTNSPLRQGSSIVEMIAAGVLLGVVFVTMVPVLSWAGAQRQAADQRQCALQEVANLMERIALQPWATMSNETLSQFSVSPESRQRLKDARLVVRVAEEPGTPAAKRVTAELSWRDRTGTFVRPVRLTAWFYRQGETS